MNCCPCGEAADQGVGHVGSHQAQSTDAEHHLQKTDLPLIPPLFLKDYLAWYSIQKDETDDNLLHWMQMTANAKTKKGV